MTRAEQWFSIGIRLVFIFAFGAFLAASIHHVAAFFHNFEPSGTDWTGSEALAVSVDGTALVLTIGVMFFSRRTPWHTKALIWFFILALTGFSWLVNWEYAMTYQQPLFSAHLDPIWQNINPILASSFAFLNMVYSIVAEIFGTREKSLEELRKELEDLQGERGQLLKQIQEAKGPGLLKQLAQELKEAKELFDQTPSKQNTENQAPKSEPESEKTPAQNLEQKPEEVARFRGLKETKILENGEMVFVSDAAEIGPENSAESQRLLEQNSEEDEDFSAEKHEDIFMQNLSQKDTMQSSDQLGQLRETDPQLHVTNPRITVPLSEQNGAKKQVRYTLQEAVKLPVCRQRNVKISELKNAVKTGILKTNSQGCISKSALEEYLKTRQKAVA